MALLLLLGFALASVQGQPGGTPATPGPQAPGVQPVLPNGPILGLPGSPGPQVPNGPGQPGPAPNLNSPPPAPPGLPSLPGLNELVARTPSIQFPIDPKTPAKDLLPTPPPAKKNTGPVLTDDLALVPEVEFEQAIPHDRPNGEAAQQIAQTIAKINHVNSKKADAFMETLRGERADIGTLPMAMGDACRTRGERNRQFTNAVNSVRNANPAQAADNFWEQYRSICIQEDRTLAGGDPTLREHVTPARVAALAQIMAPTPVSMRLGLVKHLSTISHADATRAIARLAIFSAEDEIRTAAVDALKVRREKDYTDILMQGLRYPWPAVAKRASEVLVKLERTDMIPQLLDALEEADPRLPTTKEGSKPQVRELVRINHNRNCLLCHAPGNTPSVAPETLTAGVPVPGTPLNPPNQGYGNSIPDILVRLDVTYLRQDFSLMQAVAEAGPWPEMQRFDFVVRTRTVTEEEAKEYREKLTLREKGQQTPYRRAVLTALREMTGKDTEPTPEAWRKLLGMAPR
jgi:hypothetical protein